MLSPEELDPFVHGWLKALAVTSHATAGTALAHRVTALPLGQSLRPTALMRALWSPEPVAARRRSTRVARALDRPWLIPACWRPRVVRATLAWVAPEPKGRPLAAKR